MLRRIGVRGRLLLAFLGISAFALIAAAAAMVSFSEVGGVLARITGERVPAALDAMELSRQAERIVAAAPKLLAVSSRNEQAAVSDRIAGEVVHLHQLHQGLDGRVDPAALATLGGDIGEMAANLSGLDAAVAQRLALAQEREATMRRVLNTARTARRVSEPGQALIELKLAEWRRAAAGADHSAALIEPAELTETLGSMLPQQRAELVVATLTEVTLRIATADDPAQLAILATPVKRSLDQLEEHIAGFPPKLQARAQEQFATFEDGLLGARGLIALRGLELAALKSAQTILDQNAAISARLRAAVDQLIADARGEMSAATADAAAVQRASSRVLIAVVLLSLLSSGLIVWLYVHRDLLRRLSALSGSMMAVAGGNLRVPLPPADGRDEIADMTRALTVFRDTAVEIDDHNLRQIATARQRLIDAIESISEGFAFYDADDRLELCNTQYRKMLYAGQDVRIEPGMPFAAIVRQAAELGLIHRDDGDIEALVGERLARHRTPGAPLLQRRADGRWVQISERRTEGGGTVAVYSDLTELKGSEQRAAAAHRTILESLRYASRIQAAVLPAPDALGAVTADHFLIWEPRDIVGGDFFWLRQVQGGYMVTVGDCTGHGVPGAFMTLITCGLLDRMLRSTSTDTPSRVLSGLHRELQALLGQESAAGDTDDGLEVGVCFVSAAERRLVFAGAHLSLWCAKGGTVDEVKGGKAGIGYRRLAAGTSFIDVPVELDPGAAFYLTTDGLIDQVGGERRRSFGKRRFAAFVAEQQGRPMAEQALALRDRFATHQGIEARRDDVTVLGFTPSVG